MNDEALRACSASTWAGDSKHCRWCDAELTGRRSRWCSDECANNFGRNHWWGFARNAALRRDNRKCVRCDETRGLQVHHKKPILGRHGVTGCHHHLDGLITLCHVHHLAAHAELRAELKAPEPPDEQMALEVY